MKSINRKAIVSCSGSLIAITVALATPGALFAQTPKPAAQQPKEEVTAVDIIVTGTRLATGGFTSPTPTTMIGASTLEARAATSVANVLFELPSIRPAPFPQGTSQAGGNFVNLRGLGNARSLVLVDGRRFVPSNNLGQVDINVVPTALIERIDAVTGGASAAYGSDAVSGVVNLVFKKKLEGFQGNLQYGLSQRGDAREFQGSLAWGDSFADGRGQVMIAGEYSNLYDMPTQNDRAWSRQRSAYDTSKTRQVNGVTYDRVRTDNLTMTGYTAGGVIVQASGAPLAATSPLYGRQFLTSTSSAPFNYGQILGNSVAIGGDGAWVPGTASPSVPLKRQAVFGRVSYELSSNISAWAEASYARTRTNLDLFVNSIPSASDQTIAITNANPYIPADIRAIMTANNITSFSLGRLAPDLGFAHTDSRNRILRGAIGFDGKLGENYSWSAYYTHGETHFNTDYSNNIIEANLRAALDVVVNPATGQPDCRINITPPVAGAAAFGAAAGCKPANPFGVGSLASVKNYVTGTLNNIADYHQDAGAVTLSGEPFSTWAAPVSFTVGGEFRREYLTQVVSDISNFINPPFFASGGFQQANPKSFQGGVNVKEVFGEVGIPLLRDVPFGKSLALNGAVRVTDYSTSGTVTTWKVGGVYIPIDGLLFRATRSRDIRAANTSELYVKNTTYGAVKDWGVAGAPNVNFVARGLGNTALRPEIADTITAGVSLSGGLIPRLSLSVDWYDIKLRDTIGQLGTQAILDTCYGQGTAAGLTPDPSRCALINRASSIIDNPFLNLGTLQTNGVDFEGSYRLPLSAAFGTDASVSFRGLASYVSKLIVNTNGLLAIDRTGDVAFTPKWRFTASATLSTGPLALFLQGRYIGPQDRDKSLPSALAFDDRTIPAIFYLSSSVRYRIIADGNRRLELYANVDNLLDKDPPFAGPVNGLVGPAGGQGGLYANAAIYDTIGRAFKFGIRFKY